MKYKGGTQKIVIGKDARSCPNIPGSAADLKPGVAITIPAAQVNPDGTLANVARQYRPAATSFRNRNTARSHRRAAHCFTGGRQEMNRGLRTAFAMAAVGMLVATSIGYAQQKPVRIRGTIEKVDGQNLEVKSREGKNLKVVMSEKVRFTAMVKASLTDLTPDTYIGVTAMPDAGRHPARGRDPHLPAGAARHRRRPSAVGFAARQHHDQRRDRHHRRRHRRPGGDGALQGQATRSTRSA